MVKAIIQAARLRTLPLAVASIAMGAALAHYFFKHDWVITVLALVTAILLQVLSNFANDYGDFQHGADDETRTDRVLASGQMTAANMRIVIGVFVGLCLASGVGLLVYALSFKSLKFLLFLLTGVIAIVAAIRYTAGKNPYGYRSWGDAAVFLFFGIIAVLGVYYLHTETIDRNFWLSLLPAGAMGLLATGVLNVNNMRDEEKDKAAGKNTLVVRLGNRFALNYQLLLYLVSLGFLISFSLIATPSNGLLYGLLFIPYVVHWLRLKRLTPTINNRPHYNTLLKVHVLLNLIAVILTLLILM